VSASQPASQPAQGDSAPSEPGAGYPYRWLILAVMLTAEIMDLLDSTVVNVAGPSLKDELGASPTALQWVIGGYALTLGAFLILGGRLGDRYGRRNLFLIGLISFTAASLACALAPTIETLIAFRLIQGAAGALLLPQGFGLLRAAFPPHEIGKAFAVFGPVFGLGGILGPIIGGGLIEADILDTGWRMVFVVNIPIGIAAVILAWRIVPRVKGDHAIKIDLPGAAIIAVSSGLLVWPLVQGQAAGWPAWTWLCIAAAFAGFFLFSVQQRMAAGRGGTPLVTPSIFRSRAYTIGLAGIALFFAGQIGVQLVLTLFVQIGQGFSAWEAGLANIAIAVGSGIGGAVSGAVLADKLGRSVLQIGAAVQLAGGVLLFIGLNDISNFTIWQLVPGMLVVGLGTGLVVAALFNVILASVGDHEVGSASGVLTAVQSIAGAAGVAIFGSVFFAQVQEGDPGAGFQQALLVLGVLLVLFLAISPLFPTRARAEDGAEGSAEESDQASATR